jgi:predicted alpha-1,6-mannanase (GH76 family)
MKKTYQIYAEAGIQALQQWYDPAAGLWQSTNWWNAANALWVLIEFSDRMGITRYQSTVAHTFNKNRRGKFCNKFYDDEGWWALTWIRAYDMTHQRRYLVMAQKIFADMLNGWDMICGGGVWWTKERTYKNAVTNELFFTIAVRLALRMARAQERAYYADWAQRGWNWFACTGMINADYLVNDGINKETCLNNQGVTWTYNQGILLGGLADMFHLTREVDYLVTATAVAEATIHLLVDQQGILQEPCEDISDCGADGPQFKGIFMRNLAALYEEVPKDEFRHFILRNVQSIVQNNMTPLYQFGLRWSGPVDSVDAARQSSALDALNAALMLEFEDTGQA